MLVIISPAKALDFKRPLVTQRHSQPDFLQEAEKLVKLCQKLTPAEMASLMKISDKLAALNVSRYAQWSRPFTAENARPAVLAFDGEVYHGLSATSFNDKDFDFAQNHLRILSGLYGCLRPLDLIQPYRLEMGIQLKNPKGGSLYDFWKEKITEQLNQTLQHHQERVLINLASDEYSKVIAEGKLQATIIKPVFWQKKGGRYKVIAIYAKKARGLMSRFIIQHRLTHWQQLSDFNLDDYYFDEQSSNEQTLVYKRD